MSEIGGLVTAPLCPRCDEPVLPGEPQRDVPHIGADEGPEIRAWHEECFARSIVGSVGHQCGWCYCHGGTCEDPPNMTKREAARAAVGLFRAVFKDRRDG